MNNTLKAGMIFVYAIVALIIGVSIYDSIAGTSTLDFLRNAKGGFLISALIMSGSVIMLIGGILSVKKYQTPTPTTNKITSDAQIDYLNDVLKTGDISEAERKNIEKKIEELTK